MRFSTAPSRPRTHSVNAAELGADPFLSAFESFQGSFLDLESGVRTSADEWKRLTDAQSRELKGVGFERGDRAIMALPNGALFASCWAAIIRAGGAPLPVDFESPGPELALIAARSKARLLVTESGWERIEPARRDQGVVSLPSVPLHLTSGSTGGPKIAVRPGLCAAAEALHYIETLGIDDSDVILCVSPMSHAYAYGMCLMVPLIASAEVLVMRRFNPRLASRALSTLRVTLFPAIPAILDIFPFPAGADHLRAVLSAGAPLSRKTAEKYCARYGIRVRPLFGSTETGGISIAPAWDEFDGSVGPPMKGVEVRVDSDGFENSIGRLHVRSSSMMAGYLGEERIERDAIDREGWFSTGDLARVEQGRIFLRGRDSELINVFGLKVNPSEVEGVLSALPEVAEVKVYAGKHRSGSEVVQAAVVRRDAVDEDRLREHCKRHLVAYKCPSGYRFVDALPRTRAGKIDLRRLPA